MKAVLLGGKADGTVIEVEASSKGIRLPVLPHEVLFSDQTVDPAEHLNLTYMEYRVSYYSEDRKTVFMVPA